MDTLLRLKKAVINADTAAFLLFSLIAGAITFLVEVVFVRMTLGQWFWIRVIYNGLRLPGGRLVGILTDKIREGLPGNRLSRAVAATSALLLYNLPIYAFSAAVMGATANQIATASAMYVVDTVLCGWLYGIILERARAYANSRRAQEIKQAVAS